jgi:hypothetical protein
MLARIPCIERGALRFIEDSGADDEDVGHGLYSVAKLNSKRIPKIFSIADL